MGARNLDKGTAAIEQIVKDNAQAESKIELIKVDVTDQTSVTDAAAEVKDRLGSKKLYGLINNAGCIIKPDCPKDQMINTNFYGPKLMSDAFVPLI